MSSVRCVRPLALALVLAASSLLSACVPLALGGAYVGTTTAIDRRTVGTQVEDKNIQLKVASRVGNYEKSHVNTNVYNGKVLLTGEVPTEAVKQDADMQARTVENVRQVVNELQVGMLPTSVATRSNDVYIEGKIKAALVGAKDLVSSAFDVVVENGVAYVMGRVTEREGTRATSVIAGVSGVTKVVKVFDYMTEEELQNLGTVSQPAAATPSASAAAQQQSEATPVMTGTGQPLNDSGVTVTPVK